MDQKPAVASAVTSAQPEHPHYAGKVFTISVPETIVAAVLFATMIFAFAGCGGGSAGANNPPGGNSPQPAPTISNVSSGSVTTKDVTISWSTDQPATSQVEYGTTTGYGSSTAVDSAPVTAHSVVVAGLAGGTSYHFRVKSGNANGNAVSGDYAFTTATPPAPAISNVAAAEVTTSSATITWTTDQIASSQVEYGTTIGYGFSTVEDRTGGISHSVALTALASGVTYHFRVRSNSAYGNSVSPDFEFKTVSAAMNYTDVKAAPRTIALIVHGDVTAADTNGLVAQLAQTITADYAIKSDANDPVVTTTIIPSPADAAGVVSALKAVDHLWGVMLIGKVPAPIANFPYSTALFDEPYRIPNCSQYTVKSDGTISYSDDPWVPTPECEKPAWLSRIYGTTSQVIAFIQKDIDTRHTSAPLQQYEYVRAAWFGGMPDPDMPTFWADNALYPSSAVNYVMTDGTTTYTAASRLQNIKDSLAYGTEFLSIYVHGAPESIMVEGSGASGADYSNDAVWFTSSDLLAVPNHSRVINMISCSTGDFSDPNYFAGAALFGGDTLLVAASTSPVLISSDYEAAQVEKKYHLLANGATFADIDMVPGGVTLMFGDPTISLRPQPAADGPVLTISTDGVNFSRIHGPAADYDVAFAKPSLAGAKVEQTVMLGNGGTTDLAVQVTFHAEFSGVDGKFPCAGSCGMGGGITLVSPEVWKGTCDTSVCNPVLTIPAGQSLPITFGLEPIFVSQPPVITTLYGTTSARFEIHTVDPRDRGLGSSDPKLGRLNLYLSGEVKP